MTLFKILDEYDGDHDLGPDAPVPWHVKALADAIIDLREQVAQARKLDRQSAEMVVQAHQRLDAIEGAREHKQRQERIENGMWTFTGLLDEVNLLHSAVARNARLLTKLIEIGLHDSQIDYLVGWLDLEDGDELNQYIQDLIDEYQNERKPR